MTGESYVKMWADQKLAHKDIQMGQAKVLTPDEALQDGDLKVLCVVAESNAEIHADTDADDGDREHAVDTNKVQLES